MEMFTDEWKISQKCETWIKNMGLQGPNNEK